jgi:hypothetical protein
MFFVSRVELHDVSGAQSRETYQRLHDAMQAEGFSRSVTNAGETLHLPPGEYAINQSLTVDQVHEKALSAAKRIGHRFEVLTNQSAAFRETGLARVQ